MITYQSPDGAKVLQVSELKFIIDSYHDEYQSPDGAKVLQVSELKFIIDSYHDEYQSPDGAKVLQGKTLYNKYGDGDEGISPLTGRKSCKLVAEEVLKQRIQGGISPLTGRKSCKSYLSLIC